MKRKFLAVLMAMALGTACMYNFGFETRAEEISADAEVDESYAAFGAVDALTGQADVGLCGIYLAEGYSIINKISSTKVGIGGITNAALRSRVSTNTILEKLDDGSWVRFNSWTTTVESGFTAGVDQSDIVDKGYYYRVRSYHRAGIDTSSSYTNNLWM